MKRYLSILSHGSVIPSREPQWADAIPAALKRRDPRIWQLAWLATKRTLENISETPKSIIVGTALGALDETKGFLDGVFGEGFGSPRNFIASVHNSMAGKIALEQKITGPNLTVCDGHNSFASAIATANILDEKDFPVLMIIIDERIELLDKLQPHFSEKCKKFNSENWDDGAVAFLLSDKQISGKPSLRSLGPALIDPADPEKSCAGLIQMINPDFKGKFLFNTCSNSYLQPAICADQLLSSPNPEHVIIGSFSPVSEGAAVVEIYP
jgi:hypothetical protein